MKILRILFLSIIPLLLIVFLYILNSSFVVQKIFEYVSKEVPFKYSNVEGTLYSGISIKNLDYENNLKIENFQMKPEILSLLNFEIYIKDLKLDGIFIDNKLFENEEETSSTKPNLPFKLYIKNLEASLYNYTYENYKIENLLLKGKNIDSDLNSLLSGDFNFEAKSNIANLEANIILEKNNYKLKSNIVFNKEFIDKNIIESSFLDNFFIEANGDLNKIDFQINTKKLTLKANKPIYFKDTKATGTYEFSTFNLNITNLNTILNYDFINSNINGSLNMKNNDINSLFFESNLETSIKKNISDKLQKDLEIKTKLSGNLKEINFSNILESNNLTKKLNFDGNTKFDDEKITILANLNLNSKAIGLINLNTIYKKNFLDIKVKSKLLNASIFSKDLNRYLFDLDIKEINPNEFYKLDENIKISSLKGKIKGEFEKNLSLKGNLTLNNLININANLSTNKDELQGEISSKSFNSKFFFKNEKLSLKTQIKELKDFENDLHKVLEISKLNLSGALNLQTQMENSDISFELSSPKILFENEVIEKVDIQGNIKENIIIFNKLNFYISNIYGVTLEKNFALKNQAFLNSDTLNGNFDFDDILLTISKSKEDFHIKIDTKKLLISHKDYGKANLTSNILVVINSLNKVLITGDIKTNKLNINYEIPNISISKDKDIIIIYKNKNKKEKDAFFEDFALELSILVDDLKYKVKNIDLNGSASLALKKDFYGNIKIFGSLQNIFGTFSELGKTYTIKDSNIYFRGLEPINPLLDIHATYDVNEIDISIILSGTLNEPRINLSSTPIMSQKDILSYLIFGTTFSSSTQTNTQSKQSQASLFLLNELSKDYAKELGIDILYFQYDPTTQYIQTFVGKNLSQKSKIVLKNKSTGGEIILMRELTKLWNIELGFEEDTQSLDLIYKKRY